VSEYTLLHGDCLELMPGIKDADMIFTDPPYGHNNNDGEKEDLISVWERALGNGKPKDSRPIANDGPEANDLYRAILLEAKRILKPGCCCCCGGGGGPDPQFARWSLWMDEILEFKQMVVWDKGPMGMGWHYRRSYETVLVGVKPGAPVFWYDTSKRIENIIRPGMFNIRKIIPSAVQHPTEKPWQLAAHFIGLHTKPGDLVIDPFMGGGSTAEAAFRMGRRFIGIEKDDHWFGVAKRKMERIASQMRLAL